MTLVRYEVYLTCQNYMLPGRKNLLALLKLFFQKKCNLLHKYTLYLQVKIILPEVACWRKTPTEKRSLKSSLILTIFLDVFRPYRNQNKDRAAPLLCFFFSTHFDELFEQITSNHFVDFALLPTAKLQTLQYTHCTGAWNRL